jgi:hypothetical protein
VRFAHFSRLGALLAVCLTVGVAAVGALPVAPAEAAYPSCASAWYALNGSPGDDDLFDRYGGRSRRRVSCGHGGGSTYTYTAVQVYYGITSYVDQFVSYLSPGGVIWDRFDQTICSIYC